MRPGAESPFHFDPANYHDWVREEIPLYDDLQERVARATASVAVAAVLDLGSGTGETLARVLALHPGARAVGVDENPGMLDVARARLADRDATFGAADLSDPLPPGPFDLVVSVLAVHHLDGPGKAALFRAVADVLRPGGRFVLGDVVVPGDSGVAPTPLTDDYDKPSRVDEQLRWMGEAGLVAALLWQEDDLAVLTADRPAPPR